MTPIVVRIAVCRDTPQVDLTTFNDADLHLAADPHPELPALPQKEEERGGRYALTTLHPINSVQADLCSLLRCRAALMMSLVCEGAEGWGIFSLCVLAAASPDYDNPTLKDYHGGDPMILDRKVLRAHWFTILLW